MTEMPVCSICGNPVGTPVQHYGSFNGRVGYLELEINARDIRSDSGPTEICFTCVASAIHELYYAYSANRRRVCVHIRGARSYICALCGEIVEAA